MEGTSGKENSGPSSGSTYGFFKVKTAKMITSPIARELATVFDFSTADIECVVTDGNPGLTLITKMEGMDIISKSSIDKLINAMENIKLNGLALQIKEEYSIIQESEATNIHVDSNILREMYLYLTDEEFKLYKPRGKEKIDERNSDNKQLYEKRIANYSLKCDSVLDMSCADEICNIALLGKTGHGKSSTGNTIVGSESFHANRSSESATKATDFAKCKYNDCTITVVDTPGVHDTSQDKSYIVQELARIAFQMRRGVHCFIICLTTGDTRFTKETEEMVKMIKIDDRKDFFHYCMLVYTKAETDLNTYSLDAFLQDKKQNEANKSFLDMIGDRVVAINNKTDIPAEKLRNREAILAMVEKVAKNIRERNMEQLFTNATFKEADKLHKKVSAVVADQECGHLSLVNAVIETVSTGQNLKEDLFVKAVIKILRKCQTRKTNKENDDFKVKDDDGKVISISYDTCVALIKNIHKNVHGDIVTFFSTLIAGITSCTGIAGIATTGAGLVISETTGIVVIANVAVVAAGVGASVAILSLPILVGSLLFLACSYKTKK